MSSFMEIRSNNRKVTQKQLAKELGVQILQLRHRKEINMDSKLKKKNIRREKK